ncbi:LADA_0G06348g1_1 [Lachancea dasiensis]|uniref:LADA_0G06348g1_1 n=1 Tax=Lachancea dasiensis TaxID=1072105 RepID=A0A1G4JTI9_9SACH|nr:LADA_0G06348g1_1 [Lachancea dasiensis]
MNAYSISSRTTQTSSVFSAEDDDYDAKLREIEEYYVRTLLEEEPAHGPEPNQKWSPNSTTTLSLLGTLNGSSSEFRQPQQHQDIVGQGASFYLRQQQPQLEVEINSQYMPASGIMPLTSENLKILQNPKLTPQRPECLTSEPTPTSRTASSPSPTGNSEKCNKVLYKTELCESFSTKGHCRYGSNCQFAHGLQELKFKERNNKFRTKPCVNWMKTGTCPYRQRCCFKHGDDNDIKMYLRAGHIPIASPDGRSERKNLHANVQALQKMAW